jgi:diguanylate cyclase (GGDEF)-like protein
MREVSMIGETPVALALPLDLVVVTVAIAVVASALVFLALRRRNTVERSPDIDIRAEAARAVAKDFERLFRFGADAMVILGPERLTILEMSEQAANLFEAPREMFLGQTIDAVVAKPTEIRARVQTVAETGSPSRFEMAHHTSQERLFLQVQLRRIEFRGRVAILSVYQDISDRKATEGKLTQQAFHDSLTGLANRALFRDRVEHAIARLSRRPETIGVMFLDLDGFKEINDRLGHAAGDNLLEQVARRIGRCVRMTDTVARLGGDEFAVLMEEMKHRDDSVLVADRMHESLRKPFKVGGEDVNVGVSIGIACTTEVDTVGDLLRKADVAMYRAKARGKGCTETFDAQTHGPAMVDRSDLRDDFRRALGERQFMLEYQPIMNLLTGRTMGAEALVRWDHPVRGRIAPGVFIPLAEKTGLIVPLGKWVIEEVCRQGKVWLDAHPDHPLTMTINISAGQLANADPDLPSIIGSALKLTGFPAERLAIEITERVMMSDTEMTLQLLRQVRALGVRIALDDFGTGYSSLAYLRRFPIDIIKIDRAFTDGIEAGADESRVARAVVAMGDALQMLTIAEGVETVEQLARLRDIGCELGQGYHLCRPVEATAVTALLRKEKAGVGGLEAGRDE